MAITSTTIKPLFPALALMLGLASSSAFATHFEISRLAAQIDVVSSQLAQELRYTRGFSGVSQRASSLSREAAELVDDISRNRSNSRIRSQFKQVSRRYVDMEEAFLRANRRSHNDAIFNEIGYISNLYNSLSSEIYFSGYYYNGNNSSNNYYVNSGNQNRQYYYGRSKPQTYYNYAPSVNHQPRQNSSRNGRQSLVPNGQSNVFNSQGNVSKDRGSRDRNARETSSNNRNLGSDRQTRSRLDYPRTSVGPSNNADHRSNVVDRKNRNDANHRRVMNTHDRVSNTGTGRRRRDSRE